MRIPVVRFAKNDRKADVMGPCLRRAAATGRSQVAAIGVAQESQRVFTGYHPAANRPGPPHFAFDKAERRVSCFYFLHLCLSAVELAAADQFLEGMRVGVDGLLKQPVKQQPARLGGPAIEPEGELVEVVGQVLAADSVVQGPGSPAFE